jgi:hypothetical protein
MTTTPELVVCHRDTDNTSVAERKAEMVAAVGRVGIDAALVAVVPVRMTEAWLLLDEDAIRIVAGNPRGRVDLGLPKLNEIERIADPKSVLRAAILKASQTTGRRRERWDKRFGSNRRQLIQRIDLDGPIQEIASWQSLVIEVETAARQLAES